MAWTDQKIREESDLFSVVYSRPRDFKLVNWCPELKDKQETEAMLVGQNDPLEIAFYVNNSFCFKESIWPLIMWLNFQ